MTTPLRTLTDIAASLASWAAVELAFRTALLRGLVRRRQLLEAVAALPVNAHARLVAAADAIEAAGHKACV